MYPCQTKLTLLCIHNVYLRDIVMSGQVVHFVSYWYCFILLTDRMMHVLAASNVHDLLLDVDTTRCPSLHIAINSVFHYDRPRAKLLQSMRIAGVPMGQVHVFLGNSAGAKIASTAWHGADGTKYYAVAHNSIDFTAMIYIAQHPHIFRGVRTWFYLHDTTEVGETFWNKMAVYCNGIPSCAVPLTRSEAVSNIGLYDPRFLASQIDNLVPKMNLNNDDVRFKTQGVLWEDEFFHRCDERHGMVRGVCAKAWKINGLCAREKHEMCPSKPLRRVATRIYGNTSAPRIAFITKCIDIIKYAANTKGPRAKMVLTP